MIAESYSMCDQYLFTGAQFLERDGVDPRGFRRSWNSATECPNVGLRKELWQTSGHREQLHKFGGNHLPLCLTTQTTKVTTAATSRIGIQ